MTEAQIVKVDQNKKSGVSKWEMIKKNKSVVIGVVILIIVFAFVLLPSKIATYDPVQLDFSKALKPPSSEHYFGTDNYGRDVFSRVVWATRIDILIGVLAVTVPFIVGSIMGLLAGYYGKWIDTILMRILDISMAFPFMVLVIMIVAILGPSLNNLYIAIWLVGWKDYSKLVRSEVLVIKNSEFIQAAKVMGYSDFRILTKHILPNVLSSAIVFATSDIVMCIIAAAGLSFLGLGVQPPTPEWGAIISEGRAYISTAWWITAFPGLFLVITGVGFSLLGDGISDILRTKSH